MEQNKTFANIDQQIKERIKFEYNLTNTTLICSFLIITLLFFYSGFIEILAEEIKRESNYSNKNTVEKIQNIKISFDSIKINNDHDLLFNGEWHIDVYVNGKRLSLLNSSNYVESGQTIFFPKGEKTKDITIMNNETIRIITLGLEYDSKIDELRDYLPDITNILDNHDPLSDDKDKSRFSVQPLTSFDRNDSIGIIAKEFSIKDNFGRGSNHNYCSETSGESGDLYDIVDTNCDFRLAFTIE